MELNLGTAPGADLVKDTDEANFMADVVEASQETPVIVDFWAPWCGPCKTLGPMLEDAVRAAKGAVKMVKLNVDEAPRLAQALAQQGLPLQSIPTVVAFVGGRPVDLFQGALPKSEISAFIDRVVKTAGGEAPGDQLSEAIEAAEEMLAQGAVVDAVQVFTAILQEDPENAPAYGGLVRAHVSMDDLDKAEAILNGAPASISTSPELEAARAQIELARQAANAGPVADLRAAVEAEPANMQARFDLAQALHASGNVDEAVTELLEMFRRDREWNDGAAKTQLFTIFDSLKPNDPVVLNGRRKLSSMIFA